MKLSQAMVKANETLRSNPKKPITLTYETNSDGDEESIQATQIGKGTFATAYLGTDGMVYLVLVDGTDPTKGMMVDMNRHSGAQPHIPIVEWVGWKKVKRKGVYEDATVYRSPLYRAPLRKADSATAWAMKKELDKALEYSRDQKKWETFVASVDDLAQEAGNYGALAFEFPARNLATDAKGQLILLDVLFDREELIKSRGGRC